MNEEVKNCRILYNPISTTFKKDNLDDLKDSIKKFGIKYEIEESKYAGHLKELIKEADEKDVLTITLGGDGTVSEAFASYNEINQSGLYTHIPTGTTNDMAKNFDVKEKNISKISSDILNGESTYIDSFKVNDDFVSYISTFGYITHIPYITKPILKKKLGHAGYVISAFPYITKKPVKYDISYETDNLEGRTNCILGAVSNSKGFGGIDLYHDISLNDGKLEFLIVKDANAKLIASLVKDYLKNSIDLKKYEEHLITDTTSHVKLKFNDIYPEFNFDNDGEKSNVLPTSNNPEVNYELAKKIRVLKRKNVN